MLADALLQARAHAQLHDARPLAVLGAPALSASMVAELAEYAEVYGEGAPWGVLDERGRLELHGPGLEELEGGQDAGMAGQPMAFSPASESVLANPFSDLGQWILKVLLAEHVAELWLRAPRGPVSSVSALAERAQVSISSASRILAALAELGHLAGLERRPAPLRLIRVPELLESWAGVVRRPASERYASLLFPGPEPGRRLAQILRARPASGAAGPIGRRACLGLFAACDALGLGHVRGAPFHLYMEDLSERGLAELELSPVVHASEADVVLRRPAFPESLFRGCVAPEGAPVADALQCWLDVAPHPARGAEQAAELARRLGLEGWGQ